MKGTFEVKSVEETWALARELAKELKPGDVVCLEGDLGAGKTTFTQGLAAALGVSGRVTSPTFCIVQEHAAVPQSPDIPTSQHPNTPTPKHPNASPIPLLVHMDLYRLHDEADVEAIGWEDYLARGALMVVEWPERAGSLIPATARHLVFTHLDGEENRRVQIDN